ncbi:unnamed protein product [Paramecium octaurelia]|uniref:Transmembrane protein n=1 Tax=Paramecium octaurelia TaxID=43137 RepID=A0A8S1WIH3_PAROT|nr:unnamed protein product [Paramecium octaurelia]
MPTRLKYDPLYSQSFHYSFFIWQCNLLELLIYLFQPKIEKEIHLKFRSIDLFMLLSTIYQYNTVLYQSYLKFLMFYINYLLYLQLKLDNSEFEQNIKHSQIKNQHVSLNIFLNFTGKQIMLFFQSPNILIQFKWYFLRFIIKSMVAYHNHKKLGNYVFFGYELKKQVCLNLIQLQRIINGTIIFNRQTLPSK